MARWEPGARERLEEAAMELFLERGYARTTVGEIAARAGLTERTFFRHFADKREVLFSGAEVLERTVTEAIGEAPAGAAPLAAVVGAFEAIATMIQARRSAAHIRARQALVAEHAELRERELIKLAGLAAAAAGALRARGVEEPTASLAAEAGVAAFRVGFEQWIHAGRPQELPAHVRAAADALRAVAAGARPRAAPARTAAARGRHPAGG